jgi:hypothetical protein
LDGFKPFKPQPLKKAGVQYDIGGLDLAMTSFFRMSWLFGNFKSQDFGG